MKSDIIFDPQYIGYVNLTARQVLDTLIDKKLIDTKNEKKVDIIFSIINSELLKSCKDYIDFKKQ